MKKYYLIVLPVMIGIGILFLIESSSPRVKQFKFSSQELLLQELEAKTIKRQKGYFKQDQPDKFLEYIYALKTDGNPKNEYQHNYTFNELLKAKNRSVKLKSTNVQLDWIQRGPGNVGGRTRGFIVDPDDTSGNTWFAGSVGGGIWKTSNAGDTWEAISDDWPNLSISSLVMAESNHNVIYAGTGEGFGNVDAILGNGIFKTIDKGQTWELLSDTKDNSDFKYVNRIVVHPGNENIVYAATNTGIFKSVDGGDNWERIYYYGEENKQRIQDLRMHPENPYELIASVNDQGIARSIDGGKNWKIVKQINEGRLELSFSKNFPDTLFAVSSQSNLYLSIDGGDNWTNTTSASKVEWLSGQGWYNNTLVGHPFHSNKLFVGGLDMHLVTINGVNSEAGEDVYDIKNHADDFITFGNLQGQYLNGGLMVDENYVADLGDIKVVFGGGKTQKAIRYTVNGMTSESLSASNFKYRDDVSVPFQVWDSKNNKQLMVSFRDQNENGVFDLEVNSLEQFFIHNAEYSENGVAEMQMDGGVSYLKAFSVFPLLTEGAVWDPDNMPEVELQFNRYELKSYNISSLKSTVWNNYDVPNYVHADHHNISIVEYPDNSFRIIGCNDGGVFLSDDGGVSWQEKVNGYVTTQFYGISKHPSLNKYLGGTQDNGTWVSELNPQGISSWNKSIGGDGFETVWHSVDGNKLVTSLYYNRLFISEDGGDNWFEVSGIGDSGDELAPFITRVTNSISNPDMLIVGGKTGIWRSKDFGKTWQKTSMPAAAWSGGDYNPQIEISPVNGRYIWAGTRITQTGSLPALSVNGGESFNTVNSPFNNFSAYISNIVAHPTEEKTAYMLFSGNGRPKIFETKDLGESWTELSGFGFNSESSNGFPNVAVYDLIVMPHNSNVIWAGTEIGIFETTDAGNTWHFADNGLPAVCIWDMKIVDKQVVVGTHGRGVWTLDIPEIPDRIQPPLITASGIHPSNEVAIEVSYKQNFDSVEVYLDDKLIVKRDNVLNGTYQEVFKFDNSKSQIDVQCVGYLNGGANFSNYERIESYSLEAPIEKYLNGFNERQEDFYGKGFSVNKQLFSNWSIHTEHPYLEASNYYYNLSYPIIILDDYESAIMEYRDIAFVEAGEAGTKYGDEQFWDYVVVEGTKDGINWLPLADGYDVNHSSKWSGFTSDDLAITPNRNSLFVNHSINLQDTFEPEDTILIRFRLHSDAATVGWGWVIDDIKIQDAGTGIFTPDGPDGSINISPNPAGEFINMQLDSREIGDVQVIIYSLSGKKDFEQSFTKNTELWKERIEIANLNPGMKLITVIVEGKVYSNKFIKK